MISFKKHIMLILGGVVLLNFILVYISFNILMNQYIRKEAERELHGSVFKMKSLSETKLAVPAQPSTSILTPGVLPEKGSNLPAVSGNPLDGTVVASFVQALPTSQSVIDLNFIILDEKSAVIYPFTQYMRVSEQKHISFIAAYFSKNTTEFDDNKLVKAADDDSMFYLTSVAMADGYQVVAYMDVTPFRDFSQMVNGVLTALLVLSGLVAVGVGIRMSGGINKTIHSLSKYAERIGNGDYLTAHADSRYLELNQLSKSMSEMSARIAGSDAKQKEFFQNVSHELRTPLMSIQGYAEGIIGEVFENPKEAAEIIVEESITMAELVSEILYISRLDRDMQPKFMQAVEVSHMLEESMERVKMVSQNQGKSLRYCGLDSPVYINGDMEKLTTAIVNILSNGIRYASTYVLIEAEIEDGRLNIRISDDGPGIHPPDLPHIFERFYMGENGHAGIGLAITKEIIEHHQGIVTAANREYGAVFSISLNILNKK